MSSTEPALTVVIPALNEENGIGATIDALKEALARYPAPVELLVVNDGSKDRTAEVARAAGARVIDHPQPGGYGRALKTGITAATHEVIAITDADGTYPVEEIPRMVALLDKRDLVVGQRTGPQYMRKWLLSPLRSAFLLLTSFVTGTWIPDPNSGLRLFRKSDLLPLLPRLPRAFSFTTTMTLIMTLSGRFIHYHPIPYRKRIGRSKVRIIRDALRVGQTLVEVILEHNPLKMFLVVAAPPALAAIVATVWSFFNTRAVVPAVALWCTAVLVFSLGMLSIVALGERRTR